MKFFIQLADHSYKEYDKLHFLLVPGVYIAEGLQDKKDKGTIYVHHSNALRPLLDADKNPLPQRPEYAKVPEKMLVTLAEVEIARRINTLSQVNELNAMEKILSFLLRFPGDEWIDDIWKEEGHMCDHIKSKWKGFANESSEKHGYVTPTYVVKFIMALGQDKREEFYRYVLNTRKVNQGVYLK